jgi:protein-S-isoprenylcysteine O-methyltransferase Ste14
MAAIVGVVLAWPDRDSEWRSVVGAALFLSGAAVVVLAARALGAGLTPFPRPSPDGRFVDRGPYSVVRHPVYSGGVLVFSGIPLALSPWALVGTAALTVVWGLKARVEERFLAATYSGYEDYRAQVRYRLAPFVY